MARTPEKTAATLPSEPTKADEVLMDLLEAGKTIPQIALMLSKGDKAKANRIRQRLWYRVRRDELLQRAIVERSRGILVTGLQQASAGQVRSARRSKTPAAKLVMEATGFHNPRVKHDHTGDIKITIDMPRPSFNDDGMGEDS